MNDFFKSAWSFVLSSVIETKNVHQEKVKSEVANCLDSCDVALAQRQNLLFQNIFEKLTVFDFKFLQVCSLVCSLPVIPCKDDKPNLDGMFKTISNFMLLSILIIAHIEHRTKDFLTKIF